jgi:hypothetical protein
MNFLLTYIVFDIIIASLPKLMQNNHAKTKYNLRGKRDDPKRALVTVRTNILSAIGSRTDPMYDEVRYFLAK